MGVGAAVVALAAAPFLLAAPQTLSAAGGFRIPVEAGSVLRLLGVTAAATPSWDRPVQLLLALALGLAAVRRGRWPAVLLLAVDARILLDPSVNTYYVAWLLVGTATWELWRAGGSSGHIGLRAPLSLLGFLMLFVPILGPVASVVGVTGQAWLRAGFVIGSAVAVLVGPRRSDSPSCQLQPDGAWRTGVAPISAAAGAFDSVGRTHGASALAGTASSGHIPSVILRRARAETTARQSHVATTKYGSLRHPQSDDGDITLAVGASAPERVQLHRSTRAGSTRPSRSRLQLTERA